MPVIIEKKNEVTGAVEKRVYETVGEMLRLFREMYPASSGWGIHTKELTRDSKAVFAHMVITDPQGRIIADGVAEETRNASLINQTSAVENAQTSAWGRALRAGGFTSSELCSADELLIALKQQEGLRNAKISASETATQKNSDEKASAVGDNPSSPTGKDGKDDEQNQQSDAGDDGLSELPDGLPKLNGVKYRRENGVDGKNSHIVAEGSVFKHRTDLKDAGFTFSQPLKKWVYAM